VRLKGDVGPESGSGASSAYAGRFHDGWSGMDRVFKLEVS
jgi:hypothetical protein